MTRTSCKPAIPRAVASALLLVACTRGDRPGVGWPAGEIEIRATDEGFAAPDTVASGLVHVVFENHGSAIHEAMFVRLPDGMRAEDFVEAVRGGSLFPPGALDYAGPGLTSPGGRVEQWLHLDPGSYVLACWFRGHLKEIPPRTLTVVPARPAQVRPPPEDMVLRLRDFRFELEGLPAAGSRVIRVEAIGPSLHEVDVFRLLPGRTLADLRAWQAGDRADPAPVEAVGGVLDSHRMPATTWLRVMLRPGRYVLWCSLPMGVDAAGRSLGGSHAEAGMVREFEVTEPRPSAQVPPARGSSD